MHTIQDQDHLEDISKVVLVLYACAVEFQKKTCKQKKTCAQIKDTKQLW